MGKHSPSRKRKQQEYAKRSLNRKPISQSAAREEIKEVKEKLKKEKIALKSLPDQKLSTEEYEKQLTHLKFQTYYKEQRIKFLKTWLNSRKQSSQKVSSQPSL